MACNSPKATFRAAQARAKTCVILLNWNGATDTLNCLDSLKGHSCDVLVVDNGSTDDSVEVIQSVHPKCTLLENGVNLGYAGGNNVGICWALERDYPYLLILNNDTVIEPGYIAALEDCMERSTDVGILGSWIIRMDQPDLLDHLGGVWNRATCAFDYAGYREDSETTPRPETLDYVCGAAVMVKREVFESVGLFDPRFFLFWEEADLCFAARRAGFSVSCCKEARVHHKISASFTGGKPHASYFLNRNRLLWIEKNIAGPQKGWLLAKVVSTNLVRSATTQILRGIQLLLQLVAGSDTKRNRERLLRARAVSTATWDYLLRRFYAGRSKNFMDCH